jgi:flavin reductase (DIM6/NTAB) family NADH-FMN oxidoreductase RutF
MVAEYCLFILEVVKAWADPAVHDPRTLHHRGKGRFMVAGETIKLKSKMKKGLAEIDPMPVSRRCGCA